MSGIAIGFMIFSMVTLWGGLAWSLFRLRKNPEVKEDETSPPST